MGSCAGLFWLYATSFCLVSMLCLTKVDDIPLVGSSAQETDEDQSGCGPETAATRDPYVRVMMPHSRSTF